MFDVYILFLILGGIAMLVMAGMKTGQKKSRRIWNTVLGAGFTIYGLYLLLFFQGGHYELFYYVFILPILMIVQFFRDRSAYQARQQAPVLPTPPPPGYAHGLAQAQGLAQGQPAAYGQGPGYGQPSGFDQPTDNQPRGH